MFSMTQNKRLAPWTLMAKTALTALAIVAGVSATAAEYTVTNDNSDGSGSLLEAVQLSENTAGADSIVFDATFFSQPREIQMIDQFIISQELSIVGPGANNLTINNQPGFFDDLFVITNFSSSPVTVSMENFAITTQFVSGQHRRQIYVRGANLFLRNVNLTGNGETHLNRSGTGIVVEDGDLTMQDCQVQNFVSEFRGGAVFMLNDQAQSVLIDRCSFQNNRVTGDPNANNFKDDGGALYVGAAGAANGTRVIVNESEFSVNNALEDGGAIAIDGHIGLTVTNSTVSGNIAGRNGGGIHITNPNASFRAAQYFENSTITNNSASGFGGGVFVAIDTTLPLLMNNTVIAGNSAQTTSPAFSTDEIVNGDIVASYSLFGAGPGDMDGITVTEHQSAIGSVILDTNPQLGPLADNGGPTRTHAPNSGSPLIDAGRANASPRNNGNAFPTTDQRGAGFARSRGANVDIGALEVAPGGVGPGGGGGSSSGGGGAMNPLCLLLMLFAIIGIRRTSSDGSRLRAM